VSTKLSLTDELTRLPAQPIAAVRVLRLVENRDASAADLARLIETDPALSARVMRLANAPYYGLVRKVSSASRAVVLLGFNTVRSLAVGAACGLLIDEHASGPSGFWTHCVISAAACSVVARHVGFSRGDAFSAGLLHDVGTALLFRHDPEHASALVEPGTSVNDEALAREREVFGLNHAEVGATVLETWRFPAAFVDAVAMHHHPPASVPHQLTRVVIAGGALGHYAGLDDPDGDVHAHVEAAFDALRVRPEQVKAMAAEVQREMGTLAGFLGVA